MTTSLAVAADLEALLPGVVAKVPGALITTYLELTANAVGNVDVWGTARSNAHALLTLHSLAKSGMLATYNVEDPGEAGVLVGRGAGASRYSFATPKEQATAADADKSTTVWGRLYLEIWRAKGATTAPLVLI